MTEEPLDRFRAWFERGGWTQVWHVVYMATLIGATGAALADGEVSVTRRGAIAAFVALEVAWYVLIALRWRYWEASSARYAVSLAIAGALWLPLSCGIPPSSGRSSPPTGSPAARGCGVRSLPSPV